MKFMRNDKSQTWYRILYISSFYLMAASLIFSGPYNLFEGMKHILAHPSLLLTDYMYVGGIGVALFNSGLMTFLALTLAKLFKIQLNGICISAILNLAGFALLGKNLYNCLALFCGSILNGLVFKKKIKDVFVPGLFAMGLAPLISYTSFYAGIDTRLAIVLANGLGLLAGFLLPILSSKTSTFHEGYSLYNSGMALGIIAIIISASFAAFGYYTSYDNVHIYGVDKGLLIYVTLGFILMLVPMILKPRFKEFRDMLKRPGKSSSDFFQDYSWQIVLFNMGLLGLMALAYVVLVGADLNGISLGAIMVVAAFGTSGVHPVNALPMMLGVGLAAHVTDYGIASPSAITAATFGTTLSPIAGTFGPLPGFITGFVHLLVVTRMGRMHGNLLLYNNGLTGGLVAGTMVTIFKAFKLRMNTYDGDPELKNPEDS